jgi:hypothetical protein
MRIGSRGRPPAGRNALRLVLALLVTVACQNGAVEREAARLRRLTVPPGEATPAISRIAREDYAVEMGWEVTTRWGWRRYAEWVQIQLEPEFDRISITPTRMTFRRRLGGDVHTLKLGVRSGGSPLRVAASFEARAD